jgi:hypothetical protein
MPRSRSTSLLVGKISRQGILEQSRLLRCNKPSYSLQNHAAITRILLPLVKEGRKFRVKFFYFGFQVGDDSCIGCVSLESRSVQGKIILDFFKEKCPFVNIVNGIFGVDAG